MSECSERVRREVGCEMEESGTGYPQKAIIMISAMTHLCLDAQAPPNSGGAAMMVGGAAMMVGGVQ